MCIATAGRKSAYNAAMLISWMTCVILSELPSLLPVGQLSEALLWLHNGPHLLARVMANMTDCFDQGVYMHSPLHTAQHVLGLCTTCEIFLVRSLLYVLDLPCLVSLFAVVTSLVLNGETLDEVSLAGRCRTSAIHMLCHMHPAKSAYVQALAISNCKHPTLALSLALEEEENRMRCACMCKHVHAYDCMCVHICYYFRFRMVGMESERQVGPVLDPHWASGQAGVITLLHNIIIAGDDHTRAWFAQYLKCMQQKVCTCTQLPSQVLVISQISSLPPPSSSPPPPLPFTSSLLQYRRHKHSAVTKLRSYILKKLYSFKYPTTTTTSDPLLLPPPLTLPLIKISPQPEADQLMEAAESSSVIIDAGHVIVSENSDSASLEEAEGMSSIPASSSSETLEDLIDQMDIELSDREGEGTEVSEVMTSGGVAEMGVESEEGEGLEVEEEVVTSEKIETSTQIATGGRVAGEGETLGGPVKILEEEGGGAGLGGRVEEEGGPSGSGGRVRVLEEEVGSTPGGGRRRKHSSTYEKIEFPEISTEKQLSNEDIVELMELLQVRDEYSVTLFKRTYIPCHVTMDTGFL